MISLDLQMASVLHKTALTSLLCGHREDFMQCIFLPGQVISPLHD